MMTMNVGTYNNNCNGVYGNNTSDCYSNTGYEPYQYHHHHYYQDQVYPHSDYSSSANRLDPPLPKQYNNVGYYDSVIGYEYNNSTADINDLRRTEEPHYYPVQHQHYHQDDVNIITSPNGLSYTNLDYTNTENYSYHHRNASSKEYVNYETLDAKRESDHRGHRIDNNHENLDYLHQSAISIDHYQNTPYTTAVKEESPYHHHSSPTTLNSTSEYHHQTLPLHHVHQSSHQHHQSQHVNQTTPQQSNVTTYKWMQVKRNVPKPEF
ncbi:hypothetical protein PGB90_008105 [Kerria lacca]